MIVRFPRRPVGGECGRLGCNTQETVGLHLANRHMAGNADRRIHATSCDRLDKRRQRRLEKIWSVHPYSHRRTVVPCQPEMEVETLPGKMDRGGNRISSAGCSFIRGISMAFG